MLKAMVPHAWAAGIKTEEGHGGEHVLVKCVVVAVNVMAYLVVIAPHERRSTNEIIRETKSVVHSW